MEILNKEEDGKNKNSCGGRDARGHKSTEIGLGSIRVQGFNDRHEQIGTIKENHQWGDSDWKLTPVRDTTVGKILERLEIIESQYLSYVQSHQDRLKARLGESEQSKEEFLRESNQIKSDLYHLAVAQQQETNGNGHQ